MIKKSITRFFRRTPAALVFLPLTTLVTALALGVAIWSMAVAPPEAPAGMQSIFIGGHINSAVSGGDLWANWDESSEDTLDVDQDGDGTEDTFICFMENTVAGGDEPGRGAVSGADLVLTQAGNVPGATGTPPRREIADNSDGFTGTGTLFNSILKNASTGWTLVVKLNVSTRAQYVNLKRSTAGVHLRLYDAGNKLGVFLRSGGVDRLDASTANDLTTESVIWLAMWYDGTTLYGGMTTGSKPTKLSDFAAGDRVSAVTGDGYLDADIDDNYDIIGRASVNDSFLGDAYYALLSKVCLIDNSS